MGKSRSICCQTTGKTKLVMNLPKVIRGPLPLSKVFIQKYSGGLPLKVLMVDRLQSCNLTAYFQDEERTRGDSNSFRDPIGSITSHFNEKTAQSTSDIRNSKLIKDEGKYY